jgi:hypothetical protein
MCRLRSIRPITGRQAYTATGVVFALLWVATVFGQETGRNSGRAEAAGPYPRLPAAVTRVPEGLDANSPFDIKKFFLTVPRERNAAPLYLDAFFEFGNELATCFPAGAETDRRRQATSDRVKRYSELEQALFKDPKAVAPSAIDEVIKLYDTGFRKLALAQRRDQCVFEAGLGIGTLLPHIQAARQVTRVVSLKVRRALDRRDFDGASRDVDTVLRLARDLQPRAAMSNQLVAVAISQVAYIDMIPRILAASGLRIEHCDRLLNLLTSHESKSTDGYSEGLREGYLATRVTIRDLVRHQRVLAEQLGLKPGESVVKALLSRMDLYPPNSVKSFPDDADAQVARTSTAKMTMKVRELVRYYSALLELDGKPYAERIVKARALKITGGDDVFSRLVILMTADSESFMRAISRATASLRATECLVAVRRWQLGHRGVPRDMKTAIQGSPLRAVPVDPYDGKPMRLTLLNGQPVVYSIGRDGKDDGGQVDSDRDQRPAGDLIYRLMPVQAGR